jgi:mRNA interferase MazF
MELVQYAIILVNLDPTIDSEIKKTGPCVIVSPIEMNKHLKTVVICPMTSNLNNYPTRILVHQNNKDGMIVVDQIRTIDKSRIIKTLGSLNITEIKNLKSVIKETFVS